MVYIHYHRSTSGSTNRSKFHGSRWSHHNKPCNNDIICVILKFWPINGHLEVSMCTPNLSAVGRALLPMRHDYFHCQARVQVLSPTTHHHQ